MKLKQLIQKNTVKVVSLKATNNLKGGGGGRGSGGIPPPIRETNI